MTKFYKLGIKNDLVQALEDMNIIEPTPIQSLSIPIILDNKDLIGEAQTGTGKTLAFLLPLFQKIDWQINSIQGLIITPTRELALQITQVAKELSLYKPINILAAYGGQDIKAQLHKLKGNVHLIIGTPGRILDHINRGTINFHNLDTLVVDEADQIFQIGFNREIDSILRALPKKRQTLCFSATMNTKVDNFSHKYLNRPKKVTAPKKKITLDNISQIVVETSNSRKLSDLLKILGRECPQKAILFCKTRKKTNELYEELYEAGYKVSPLHGDLTQAKREFVVKSFKENKIDLLVATDVASRGLHIDGITHVFNYDMPRDIEDYIHRIGRTGRAGYKGSAYTFVLDKDKSKLKELESFIKIRIKKISVSKEKKPTPKKSISSSDNKKRACSSRTTNEKKSKDNNRSKSNKKSNTKTKFSQKKSTNAKKNNNSKKKKR